MAARSRDVDTADVVEMTGRARALKLEQRANRMRWSYNLSVGAGVVLVGVGAGVELGVGWGLVCAGAVVLILSVYAAERFTRTARVPIRPADRGT